MSQYDLKINEKLRKYNQLSFILNQKLIQLYFKVEQHSVLNGCNYHVSDVKL